LDFPELSKEIVGLMPPRELRQNLLFSATWPSAVHSLAGPRDINRWDVGWDVKGVEPELLIAGG
jgi:superfamily II DNA/RNA helicase